MLRTTAETAGSAGCSWRRWRLCPGSTAGVAGCSGARSVEEAAEHEVVPVVRWVRAGKQDHREEKADGGEKSQDDPQSEPLNPSRNPKQNQLLLCSN